MKFAEQIYDNSPIIFQNIMVTLSGYLRNQSRYGTHYKKHRKFLKDFDNWPLEEKETYQSECLVSLINYAVNNSAFYRELYKGIDISSIRTAEDLKKLPVVDKEDIRKNAKDIITVSPFNAVEGHTGGTTGKSLMVFFTREDFNKRMAMLDHFKSRVGFEHREMRRATFNGQHIVPPKQKVKVFWRYNAACKQMIYSSFHLTEKNMGYYVESLNKFKPQALDGFFMAMCDVASYIERHEIKLQFKPVAIFPTSETLTPAGRELLERVFRSKVYDQYASSEGAPFVTECKNQVLHMELASGVFEQMENNTNEILVTSFTSHGTPLIRYRIGDEMLLDSSGRKCSCGLEAPVVRQIHGRRLDFLYTAEGGKINGGNIANLFKRIPNALVRAQTIQEKLGEIIIKLEVDHEQYKSEYDDLLRDEFLHKFGRDTRIIIEHVNEITREKNGKFKLIINQVSNI